MSLPDSLRAPRAATGRVPDPRAGAIRCDADGGSGFGGAWTRDARAGVASVLRAKAPREMRHAALDLAAAVADLVGPRWLCGDVAGDEEASSGEKKSPSVSFFRLTLELTRVETAVLLHDLTRDDAAVRAAARATVSVPLVAYERLVSALAADSEAAELAEEAAAKGETRAPTRVLSSPPRRRRRRSASSRTSPLRSSSFSNTPRRTREKNRRRAKREAEAKAKPRRDPDPRPRPRPLPSGLTPRPSWPPRARSERSWRICPRRTPIAWTGFSPRFSPRLVLRVR